MVSSLVLNMNSLWATPPSRDLKVLSVRGSKCGEKLRKGTVKFCVLVGANAEENCGRGRDSVKTIIKFDH